MAEPTIAGGTATWEMQSDVGYTKVSTAINDDSVGGFILALNLSATTEDFDDPAFAAWFDASSLTQETVSPLLFGANCAQAASVVDDISSIAPWGGPAATAYAPVEFWFYDDGAARTSQRRAVFLSRDGAAAPFIVVAGIGIEDIGDDNTYVYYNPISGQWEDTGVLRSTGWHYFGYGLSENLGALNTRAQMWLDAGRILNYADNANPGYERAKGIGIRTQENGKPLYVDRIRGAAGVPTYSSNPGTVETPKAQPPSVDRWNSVGATENGIGYRGSFTYEFQWSTDGGSTYNGTWLAATPVNLQAIVCDGDGQDAIKIRVTLTRSANAEGLGIHTPRVRDLVVNFLEGGGSIDPDPETTATVPYEDRSAKAPYEERSVLVPHEDRTVVV